MQTWDIASLNIEAHQPQILRSDEEARAIAIHLPAGEELQEHQVHERAYVVVVSGEVAISAGDREVEGGPGLVAQENFRIRVNRPGAGNSLALASRQFGYFTVY